MRAFVILVLLAATARAQPVCEPCVHGAQLIDQLDLGALRRISAPDLVEPITRAQYVDIVELRVRNPKLARVGALDDDQLADVAMALCDGHDPCFARTRTLLRCLGDRCAIDFPPPQRDAHDAKCNARHRGNQRTVPIGVGFEWGNGVQDSAYPNDGRAWSFGVETRVRATSRWSAVARVDWSSGRDAAEDADGDGDDDASTGSITRIAVLGGPSLVFLRHRVENTQRYLRLDLLGGYVATRSQPDEKGVAAGADLSLHLSAFAMGLRYVQGFDDAEDARILIGHLGFLVGAEPRLRDDDCLDEEDSRVAIGFDVPLGGAGIDSQLGYLATGLGIELLWKLTHAIDVIARGDVLYYPGFDRDRVVHTALLGGLRIDHGPHDGGGSARTGWSTVVTGGYTHGAALVGSTVGSGPVIDVAPGWGIRSLEGGGAFRLHARFGLGDDNRDLIAVFVTAGFELNLALDRR